MDWFELENGALGLNLVYPAGQRTGVVYKNVYAVAELWLHEGQTLEEAAHGWAATFLGP